MLQPPLIFVREAKRYGGSRNRIQSNLSELVDDGYGGEECDDKENDDNGKVPHYLGR